MSRRIVRSGDHHARYDSRGEVEEIDVEPTDYEYEVAEHREYGARWER
mgnify:CR=1 FL=1